MTVEKMREAITEVYDGYNWERRVSLMHKDQVIAIYNTFKEKGVFEKQKHKTKCKQLNMFDIIDNHSKRKEAD